MPISISAIAANLRASGVTTVRQMEEITTELLCVMPDGGTPINSGELSGSGDPTGLISPQISGQLYHDTTTDTYYRSTGTSPNDWVVISGPTPMNLQGAGDPI